MNEERIKFFENLKKGDIIEVQFKIWYGTDYNPPIINKYKVENPKITKVKNGSDYIQGFLLEYDERLKKTWKSSGGLTALDIDNVIVKQFKVF